MKHTKEPWECSDSLTEHISSRTNGFIARTEDHDGYYLWSNKSKANAERIVLCVNALAGIENVEEFMKAVKHAVHQNNDCGCHICKTATTLFPKDKQNV